MDGFLRFTPRERTSRAMKPDSPHSPGMYSIPPVRHTIHGVRDHRHPSTLRQILSNVMSENSRYFFPAVL